MPDKVKQAEPPNAGVRVSRFAVPGMDCPSEEQLIRSAFADIAGVEQIDFDLAARTVAVWHTVEPELVTTRLEQLDLGAQLTSTELSAEGPVAGGGGGQSKALVFALAVNATMFVVELGAGWLSESTGLLADSLDMFADATVYGTALWAVNAKAGSQRRAARLSGWLQLVLALGVFAEVARRALTGSDPEPPTILVVAGLALIANISCLVALARHRRGGLHMQASWIFTTNDVIANLGVLLAGALVAWTSSAIPDLVVGTIIGAVVFRGAIRILRMSRAGATAGG